MKIDWIFFDVGSTLVNESRAYEHRIKDIVNGTSITYQQFYNKAIEYYKQNKKGDLEAVKFFNLKITPWHTEDEYVYPEANNVLLRLKKRYKIGIIANQSLGTAIRLEKMGLSKYIDLVISSAEEGVSKPDKKIFYIALERASCLPQNAVMIGDRLDNDIIPANSIGMKTIWIKQGFGALATPSIETEMPDYTAESLEDICDIFYFRALC